MIHFLLWHLNSQVMGGTVSHWGWCVKGVHQDVIPDRLLACHQDVRAHPKHENYPHDQGRPVHLTRGRFLVNRNNGNGWERVSFPRRWFNAINRCDGWNGSERSWFIRIPPWWRANWGRARREGLVPQVGGVALTCCGSIVRIPGVQLNPQLESDCMGIQGFVTYNTKGKACEDLVAFY